MKPINQTSTFSNIIFPILFAILGLYFGVMPYFHWDLSRIPGDFGDARFNYYVLEHGYRYFTGQISDYWNAPFMYPYKNVTALSDNLLGTVPVYIIFRVFKLDVETSFQLWIITLFVLNYFSCYYVLKKWGFLSTVAAVCAFIYGFGLYNHGQIFHIQMFPRFIAPLTIYWAIRFIQTSEMKFFAFLLFGMIYQFYCGIYLGFFLFYFILFLFISALIVNRRLPFQIQSRQIIYYIVTITVSIALLLPLFLPYIQTTQQVGSRAYIDSLNSLPRLRSYFFTSPASITWNFLYPYTAFKFINWWNHLLFPGIIPWLGVLLSPLVYLKMKKNEGSSKVLLLLIITFVLSFIFCINFKGYSLYKLIFMIPGFSSMRSVDRIINIQIILFLFLTAFSLNYLLQQIRFKMVFVVFLTIAVVTDNLFTPEPHRSISKTEAQANVKYYHKIISEQIQPNYKAVSVFPIEMALTKKEYINITAVTQTISIMLACQELNLKCVNGYSGFNPGSFLNLFEYPDSSNLNKWCMENGIAITDIQVMNDLENGGYYCDTIQIMTRDSMYWCWDKNYNNYIMANRKNPMSWESFSAIKLQSGKTLLSSLDLEYLKVDPFNKRLIGIKNSFINSDLLTFKPCDNSDRYYMNIYGKFVTVNKDTREIFLTDIPDEQFSEFYIKVLR
jgi:hypothetical protein